MGQPKRRLWDRVYSDHPFRHLGLLHIQFLKPMKNLIAPIIAVALFLNGCANSDQQITNAVQIAVTETITHVPVEFHTPLANYLDAAAKAVYSIDGTPTVQELITKVLAFIPKDVQDKYPLITATITTTISLVYQTYGKSALTAIGKGLEAGAFPFITKT
jgi:PBP1b-binding outer membrane lipoprotein LpoB